MRIAFYLVSMLLQPRNSNMVPTKKLRRRGVGRSERKTPSSVAYLGRTVFGQISQNIMPEINLEQMELMWSCHVKDRK